MVVVAVVVWLDEGEEREGRESGGRCAPSCIEVASVGPVGYAHINPRLPSRFTRYNYLPRPTKLPYLVLVNSPPYRRWIRLISMSPFFFAVHSPTGLLSPRYHPFFRAFAPPPIPFHHVFYPLLPFHFANVRGSSEDFNVTLISFCMISKNDLLSLLFCVLR